MKSFKPMLATAAEDLEAIKYPILVSAKFDGVRAIVIGSRVMSRSLKPIPNQYVQELFSGLPEGTDGELVYGLPTDKDVYRNTVSAVMKQDGQPKAIRFYIFDNFKLDGGFKTRYRDLFDMDRPMKTAIVPHTSIDNAAELQAFHDARVLEGYEGAMARSLDGPYKFGRSTVKEGYLLKIKLFKDAEAEVTGTYEYMHNDNEAETNELGRTERSSKKEGLRPAGILGGLEVRGINGDYKGVEFRIGGGFLLADPVADEDSGLAASSEYSRETLWRLRDMLPGKIAKFKYFPSGSKDKPRFPVFIGWRDPIDL